MRTIPKDFDQHPFDVIVVGAGVNGAGIARDAALRGLRVLLLDKGDVGSGTTSWSTRLIHGGLRYLEHAEVHLVRESLRERETLLRIAPHLVKPLPFVVPIYEGHRRGPLLIRLGMVAYDVLSFDKSVDHHHMLSREQLLREEPGLNPDGLRGAARYYDAQVEYAERLAVENAVAAREHGATVLTYARVDRIVAELNVVRGVEFTDVLGGGTYRAAAPIVVNVSGPWVDTLLDGLERTSNQMIGGTKGSHLVVDRFPGAPHEALYVEAREDGRPYFIVPWNGLYLIGTTDKRYTGDLDRVVADEAEIGYLIDETNRVIPAAGLSREKVLYSYSGVRPLPHVGEGLESGITRQHVIHDHALDLAAGLISIVGGKLTTYRNLAEQTVDAVFRKLAGRSPRCLTAELPLPGGSAGDLAGFAARFASMNGVAEAVAHRLVRVYGSRAGEVLDFAEGEPDLLRPFDPATGAIGAEVPYAVRRELAQTLTDVLMRRTMVGLGPDAGVGADEAAATVAVRHLRWDEARAAREVEAYRRYIERFKPRSLDAVGARAPAG